ncbi:MAG: hypothetical protein QOJ42_6544 [Acidobacteriaceae bacterium]|nr:hypothetical protein [Acidobacteriaceae bacterium]
MKEGIPTASMTNARTRNVRDHSITIVLRLGLGVACLGAFQSVQAESVPADSPRWQLKGEAKTNEYLGRRCLGLQDGSASLKDFEMTDGVIDVDMAGSGARGFYNILFRTQADGDGETVYLRPHKTGLDDAQQYTPILNGAAAWQLYNGPSFTRAVDIPRGAWFHVRLEITGAQAKLYIDDMREPSLIINDLKSGLRKGGVGLGGAYFSNFEVRETPTVAWERHEPATPAVTITQWSLSPSLDALERDLERPLSKSETDATRWQDITAEPPGFVVINRYRRSPEIIPTFARDFSKRLEPQKGMKVVYARTTIVSNRNQLKKLNIGYSDDVSIFLNDTILFHGRSAQRFRDPGFLGIVNPENDAVYLPLKKGRNELMLAVSELTGGWGFICRFDDMDGIH